MIRDTSLEAYFGEILPTVGARQKIVYDAIKNLGTASNYDISVYLSLPINQITPRTNELVKKNKVEQNGVEFNRNTNRKNMTWRIK